MTKLGTEAGVLLWEKKHLTDLRPSKAVHPQAKGENPEVVHAGTSDC